MNAAQSQNIFVLPSVPPPADEAREYWPTVSRTLGEEVFVKKSPGVYLSGKIVIIGRGPHGDTVYNIKVGPGRIIARTAGGLAK